MSWERHWLPKHRGNVLIWRWFNRHPRELTFCLVQLTDTHIQTAFLQLFKPFATLNLSYLNRTILEMRVPLGPAPGWPDGRARV